MTRILCAALALVCMLTTVEARPRECYGIPWCGCWLRIQLGIADVKYNQSQYWMHYGHATTPDRAAIGVMPGHVGQVVGLCPGGKIRLRSGNTWGRGVVGGVGEACYPLRAFRPGGLRA